MSKSAVKLAPIFDKSFFSSKQTGNNNKKKKQKKRKSSSSGKPITSFIKYPTQVVDLALDLHEDTETEIYFSDGEFAKKCAPSKKQKVLLVDELEVLSDTDAEESLSSEVVEVVVKEDPRYKLWTKKYENLSVKNNHYEELFEDLRAWLLSWSIPGAIPDDEESSLGCILISGAPGIGKTSIVYKVAANLRYIVFEVNCSSLRSGKTITEQLKEVTESQVINKSRASDEYESPQLNKSAIWSQESLDSIRKFPSDASNSPQNTAPIFSNSLILFDDVDVQLDGDDGFWKAVNDLISAKTPLVLTATQRVQDILTKLQNVRVLHLKPPCPSDLALHLKHILAQELSNDSDLERELNTDFLSNAHCDIRQCINQLQFCSETFYSKKPEPQNCSHLFSAESYQLALVTDVLCSKFQVLDLSKKRDFFMKSVPPYEAVKRGKSQLFNELLCELHSKRDGQCCSVKFDGEIHKPLNVSSKLEEIANVEEQLNTFLTPEVSVDYLPYLSVMGKFEENRFDSLISDSRRSRRFHHYFDSISFFISEASKHMLSNFFNGFEKRS